MAYAVAAKNGSSQVISITSFSTMRPEQEGIEAALLPPDIKRRYICKQIVHPVAVWWVLLCAPFLWKGKLLVHTPLDFALVVDTIEAYDSLQEDVKLGMGGGVSSDLEERLKHIDNHLLEVFHETGRLIHIEQTRHLNQPSDVRREELVVDDPSSKFVPFINIATVDGNPPLYELVLA